MLLSLSPVETQIVEREIIGFITYLVLCLLFYLLFVRLARKDRAEAARLNNVNAEPEPAPAHTQDDNPLLMERLHWVAELEAVKRLTAAEREQQPAEKRESFDVNLYNRMLDWGNNDLFFSQVNKRLGGLIDIMKERYPQLTDTDLLLLMLYVLQVPQTDILTLMNYSVNSLPTIKKRLCNKMNISSSANLPAEIDNLLLSL